MKKIISFISILVLALGTIAKAEDALPRPDTAIAEFFRSMKFTVTGYEGTETLKNFPVLVRISEDTPKFSYNELLSDTGEDICFIDMNGNPLAFEKDTFNPNGESLFWVIIPELTQNTEFVMCYRSLTSGKTICPQDPWTAYTGVWHLNETGNGTITVADSTANELYGTTHSTSKAKADGVIGGARFITESDSNTKPTDTGIVVDIVSDETKLAKVDALTPAFTASFWMRPQKSKSRYWYLISRKASDATPAWGLQFDKDDANFSPMRVFSAGTTDKECAWANTPGISNGKWSKVDLIYKEDATYELYINGTRVVESGKLHNNKPAANGSHNLAIGGGVGNGSEKGTRGLYGDMDEVRLRAFNPTADWVAADYATVTNPSFLTSGEVTIFPESTNPIAAILETEPGYTNVTSKVFVSDFGLNASSVTLVYELSTSEDFSSILTEIAYDEPILQQGELSIPLSGLTTNTTYFARIIATNDKGVSGTSRIASFTTLTPDYPAFTAKYTINGYTTAEAKITPTDLGAGSGSAEIWLEASLTEDFSEIAASSNPVAAEVNNEQLLTIEGLAPDTVYFLRAKMKNFWEKETTVFIYRIQTRDIAASASGIFWEFSSDLSLIDISFEVERIFDNATCTATLSYGGKTISTQSFTEAGSIKWEAIPAIAPSAEATVELSVNVDGTTITQTFPITIAIGTTNEYVSDIFDYTSSSDAIYVKPGDKITLPENITTNMYMAGNPLFISVEGRTATALRPGITSVHFASTPTNVLHSLPIIILPEKISGGDIYIFDETSSSSNSGRKQWRNSDSWEKYGSDTRESYPKNENDIAIIPFYTTRSQILEITEDITLGGLYVGQFCDTNAHLTVNAQNLNNSRKISFKRTDGNPVQIQLSSNTTDLDNNYRRVKLIFGGYLNNVEFLTDTHLSSGWGKAKARAHQGRFEFNSLTNTIPEGVMVSLYDMDTQGQNMSTTYDPGVLHGAGTFWNRSSAMVKISKNISNFTGVLRASGGYNALDESRTGPLFIRTSSATNCSSEVIGWIGRDTDGDPFSSFNRCCGSLVLGWNHFFNAKGPHDPYFTNKGLLMHNSLFINGTEFSSTWTNIIDYRIADKLTINGGFNFIKSNAGDNYPLTWFEAKSLEHNGKATLRIDDTSHYTLASTATKTNQVTIINGIESHLIGAGENPEESSAYSIVPWIISPGASNDNGDSNPIFATFNKDNRLIRQNYSNQNLDAYGENDNAYCRDKNITLSADTTFNSLVLENSGKSRTKTLGADKTLTIKSGGLILYGNNTSIGTAEGGIENGKLVLGDENLPAYVWATRSSEESPIQIWAETTAKGGFVFAYTGFLRLGGNQTGIAKEIIVNAGTLILGNATEPCLLANDLPISIYANAVLSLPNADSTKNTIINFEGCADWYGKIEIPEGVDALCRKIYTRDYPEFPEFISLARGRYTGDEATAKALDCIYDPVHFSGSGTITVTSDDTIIPTTIIIW